MVRLTEEGLQKSADRRLARRSRKRAVKRDEMSHDTVKRISEARMAPGSEDLNELMDD